jgi:hypothetical protein
MVNKGKKACKRSKPQNIIIIPNISILTPTTKSRFGCLSIVADCINAQTYLSRILEWVIVSADTKWSEEEFNTDMKSIQVLIPSVKIVYFFINSETVTLKNIEATTNYEAVGYLRNVTNWLSSGSYMVCMDDDDYYPPMRVEHAITSLRKSKKEMAGCSSHIMYDTDLDSLYQFRSFGPNHSVNNSLAYTRSYLTSGNKYDSTKTNGEEYSFLNQYNTPLIQLDPHLTIVQMVHSNNTYNKRQLVINNAWAPSGVNNLAQLNTPSHKFIPPLVLTKFHQALHSEHSNQIVNSEYDIVYYLGLGCPKWSPYDQNLGGSEQAVKHLTESWTKMGYSVAVYGEFTEEDTAKSMADCNTGIYLNVLNFKCAHQYKIVILWRNYGMHPTLSWSLKAKQIFLDIHDSVPLPTQIFEHIDKVTNIIVKSKFHAHAIEHVNKHHNIKDKFKCIPNGVRISEFSQAIPIKRIPFRFIWCSCYTRGLKNILEFIWPVIKAAEPRAEFHVFYGMNGVRDEQFKSEMKVLLALPGVTDHGRQPLDVIVREKKTATFHLYFSTTFAETDCISIRESACAGCIPLISKFNVFAERHGIHLEGDPNVEKDAIRAAETIISIMQYTETRLDDLRNQLIGKEVDWDHVSKLWLPPSNKSLDT